MAGAEEVEPRWKEGPRRKRRAGGRAQPERPMARRCEASIVLVCAGRPEHRHHVRRRSQGGGDGPENTLDLCFACHEHIHQNVDWSRRNRLLWPFIEEGPDGETDQTRP